MVVDGAQKTDKLETKSKSIHQLMAHFFGRLGDIAGEKCTELKAESMYTATATSRDGTILHPVIQMKNITDWISTMLDGEEGATKMRL